ncbi:PREDICTED: uncharacterized protein LOC108751125 isoform X2 [Trachymyrmex septentrionalis]|uniref:uncharacterized protein LOC108751125 isoform X2 n=1 Tax=Trachymyrmex septentrionalis TaxID=34720 RepID=UPI00084F5B27|nr:PREDICTED: uncharacterized protein LOC108751125 isoform X2 [Trachymyrmex septentrionalis]
MNNFTVEELKQQLRSRNLPVTGLKADLINRLQTNSSYQSYTNSSYTKISKESKLWDCTVHQLQTQLRARNLPVTGIKADLINRLQADTPYQSHVQTMNTERNRITACEKPTMDDEWFTHTKLVAHAADSTTETITDVSKIRSEDTKTADAAKVTNAARNSTDMNLIRFENTNTTAGATKATNATAEAKTVANAIEAMNTAATSSTNAIRFEDTKTTAGATEAEKQLYRFRQDGNQNDTASATEVKNAATKLSVEDKSTKVRSLFGYPRQIAKATKAAARNSTNMNTQFRETIADKTVASTTEAANAETKTSVNMNVFQFGDTKTTAGAAEAMNAAAKSSTNMNAIRFEDTKTTASAIEASNTTAEAKAVANATKETNAAVRNFLGDISKGYIGTFQFGKAKTVASAAEVTNATRNFADNINRVEGTKMAAGVTEEINPTKYFVDIHMIWREAELCRREKELAERELMLARKEIEVLRQALIDTAIRPQKICCCFERMSLQDEDGDSVSVSREDRHSCKRLEHKDQRH